MLLGLRIVGEFGSIIAVPVVLLAMLGKYLDGKFDTAPWLLISGFVAAFSLSAVSINARAKKFRDEYLSIEPAVPPDKGGKEDRSPDSRSHISTE